MKPWLTLLLCVPMVVAVLGGCQAAGVPEEWCELSAAVLWAASLLGLTTLWAPRGLPR
jgi:hypothetical protein